MGNYICNQNICKKDIKKEDAFPLMASFEQLPDPVEINPEHQAIILRLKKRLDIIDSRSNPNLNWYQSTKFNIYFYGKLQRERPTGDCFFYSTKAEDEQTPILVMTNINQHFVFSEQTLIMNTDQTVYFGAIKNNIATLPVAEGKGLLFSPEFIYEGEFKNGAPFGFGHYRSKTQQVVGVFKNGQPWGECIQKTPDELFIGTLVSDLEKTGFKITSKNKRLEVSIKKQQRSGSQTQLPKGKGSSLDIESKQPLVTQPSN